MPTRENKSFGRICVFLSRSCGTVSAISKLPYNLTTETKERYSLTSKRSWLTLRVHHLNPSPIHHCGVNFKMSTCWTTYHVSRNFPGLKLSMKTIALLALVLRFFLPPPLQSVCCRHVLP